MEETGTTPENATADFVMREKFVGVNLYAAKKTVAQGMMDVALITANANQLRFIVEYNQTSTTYVFAVTLIILSLVLQVIVGICLIFKGRLDLKGEEKFRHANRMNNYIVVGVFIITIVNVFVAAFSTGPSPLPKTTE
ncbi:hypothetical protein RUM43_008266 [Polyplax serrata]|uniref:Ninjurin-1 n=1 Tax=Polyplax serrata TaxID=468196 RepID=A0AAN8P725_POLSC